ncbi:beta-fructosidase-like proteininvertase-like proteinsucrose hydrolase-like protein [Leptomonas pyrrhocoris]|uniref:beta-fructofuranosidase n=1 Tax=Leptomonas pyrrhocoris TaxID=157538 RepID=A0A0N0DYC2_LEPPY|nr:beta-fructosidase-like proteininvertase-like proteinsucrose hydrolase-like protein [Leptomonas pyrrhocoris]XP_015662392.1 beta-fructosidase-like proteininvertase-like proteinsucrose hydrolase-like protein [Leptomonas pyrrhocoris]KPA83952.1 beta-fructosidase-like proteininvertase-like proteinsucrose hydrolase-like protein [Leptomonas pyrrhocoris]KPA83953.1 beta-fructosidase-like proteininvertase-like proteinsucrose hydrolase-like protein [Leptomonas pyrrhocoris]|eukprot:XP_015662391.1 beta-fructosidase-like proteininvertase-like proteinsucrose hydrolase-like protein [Leptomonas pyrrhocoris]
MHFTSESAATAMDERSKQQQQQEQPVQLTHADRIAQATHTQDKAWSVMNKQWYPDYHIASYAGWMGVPGGLCYHKGVYHVFYQHNPYSENWGPMHWGHLTSEDLVHWQHQPIALAPGDSFDRDGCFSGSAVSFNDKLYLFYTGHSWLTEEEKAALYGSSSATDENSSFYQQQCVAVSSDGIHFEKLGAVVRPSPGYVHFRDPKVTFREGRWWMVCGARDSAKDLGQLLLFTSDDLEHWDDSAWQVLAVTEDKNVFMWECPDLFRLEQSDVMLFSPQGKRKVGYVNRNRFQSGYMLGAWNTSIATSALATIAQKSAAAPPSRGARRLIGPCRLTEFNVAQRFREIDRGHDFYAPQTFATVDGRRIIVGWLDMWESPMPTREHGWSGCLTLPRELVLDPFTGSIRMIPPRELLQLRCAQATIPPQRISESTDMLLVEDCTAYELEVTFNRQTSTAEKYGLWLGAGVELFVDTQSNRLVLNRHYPQYMLSGYRSCDLPESVLLRLHVYVDRSSIEVFVNNGEEVFSSRIFPSEGDRTLRLFSMNGSTDMVSGNMWKLKATIEHEREAG